MGALIFLLLHALKQLNGPYDSYYFCVLVALEAPHWMMAWLYRRQR